MCQQPAVGLGFGRRRRLLSRREFDRVLRRAPVRLRVGPLWGAVLPTAPRTASRLGLIVAKRVARRAVDRNRARRVIRESFRSARLSGLDVVVRLLEPQVSFSDAVRLFDAVRSATDARDG